MEWPAKNFLYMATVLQRKYWYVFSMTWWFKLLPRNELAPENRQTWADEIFSTLHYKLSFSMTPLSYLRHSYVPLKTDKNVFLFSNGIFFLKNGIHLFWDRILYPMNIIFQLNIFDINLILYQLMDLIPFSIIPENHNQT